jgi:hypothetical protein
MNPTVTLLKRWQCSLLVLPREQAWILRMLREHSAWVCAQSGRVRQRYLPECSATFLPERVGSLFDVVYTYITRDDAASLV